MLGEQAHLTPGSGISPVARDDGDPVRRQLGYPSVTPSRPLQSVPLAAREMMDDFPPCPGGFPRCSDGTSVKWPGNGAWAEAVCYLSASGPPPATYLSVPSQFRVQADNEH